MVAYVERIAEAGQGLPVILYLRDDGIGLDTIGALCRVPGVVGLKWACPTPLRLAEAIRHSDPGIVWVGGLAETWAPPLCAVGARGFTSGLINVVAGAFGGDPCGAGGRRLQAGDGADRHHERGFEGAAGAGAQRHQRLRGEGRRWS